MTPSPHNGARQRAPRSDGLQNRARVRAAARELLATQGVAASVADIAARAGVSKGTVLRHYPTKEQLVAEVTLEALNELLGRSTALLHAGEPFAALESFMIAVLQLQDRDQAFCDVVNQAAPSDPEVAGAVARIGAVLQELTDRAKAVHAVAEHITGDDVLALTNGIHAAARPGLETESEPWRRYLDVILKGMQN